MSKAELTCDLSGKTCVVTGANTGMGRVTAEALAKMGAKVILACRSLERAEAAKKEIAAATKNDKLEVVALDLSKQASVRECAAELGKRLKSIDVLVNNAAAWWLKREVSTDGIELQWATNVLGPHLLTQLLLPLLEASGHGRIVNVASTAAGGLDLADPGFEKRKYSGVSAYSATKQANRMLTWALAERLKGKPVVANAVSPGLVATELNRNVSGFFKFFFAMTKPFAKSPQDGADTAIWLAASPEPQGASGKFFVDRKEKPCKFNQHDAVEKLWQLANVQTGIDKAVRASA
jgi:NAD(P)-dependent dehydrogenase (short-subunit alcohol dehydrogenase family)